MKTVSDAMTRGVRSLSPEDNIVFAAQAMDELNVGAIPVCDGQRLVGMVTDRDIVVRAVAQDCRLSSTKLREVMSTEVKWVRDSAPVDEVLREMSRSQVRRVPVVDDARHLVGMLSLGDVAAKGTADGAAVVGASLGEISRPARPDRSSQSAPSGPAGGGAEGSAAR